MENKRPVLQIPLTNVEKVLEVITLLVIALVLFSLIATYGSLPSRIPTHFGFGGQPDSWGGKGSLLALPVTIVIFYAGLTVLGRFPQIFNYPVTITEANASYQYQNARMLINALKTVVVLVFSYMEWSMVQVALGRTSGMSAWFLPVFLALVFGLIALFVTRMAKHR